MRPLRTRRFRAEPPPEPPAAPRPRILLVEDTPETRHRLSTLLQSHVRAADTHAVGDAARGTVLAASGRYALVVADDRLGASDGLRLLAAARRARPPCLRVLLQSSDDHDAFRLQEAAPDAVVPKPVDEPAFVRLVVELLAGPHATSQILPSAPAAVEAPAWSAALPQGATADLDPPP